MRFTEKHADKIQGTISTFDRMIFRGYLHGFFTEKGMPYYMRQHNVLLKQYGDFVQKQTGELKSHIEALAASSDVSVIYLNSPQVSKESIAKEQLALQDNREGLVTVIKSVELCKSFDVKGNRATHQLEIAHAPRKCLHYYLYFNDREFGLMHLRIQSWLPMEIQIHVNGREWLKRTLSREGILYKSYENSVVWTADLVRAQELCGKLESKKWDRFFDVLADKANPLLPGIKQVFGKGYEWYLHQCEYATDVLFNDRETLQQLYPSLVEHSSLYTGGEDILTFFGRKAHLNWQGEVIGDRKRFAQGFRVKHRIDGNAIKMYDKSSVLRIETTINNPKAFKIYKTVTRKGQRVKAWVPMGKAVSNLYRYAQVSHNANKRYLDHLSTVEMPSGLDENIERLSQSTEKTTRNGNIRRFSGFNLFTQTTCLLLETIANAQFHLRPFRNKDLKAMLLEKGWLEATSITAENTHKITAKTGRIIAKLRAHHLIKKVAKTFQYQLTKQGSQIIKKVLIIRKQHIMAA